MFVPEFSLRRNGTEALFTGGRMQKEGFQELCGLGGQIRRAAAELLFALCGARIQPADVKLPSKPGCASAALAARCGVEPDAGLIRFSPAWNNQVLEGITVFSSATVENGCVILQINDELLKDYAKLCLGCLPAGRVSERIAIPAEGITADGEAAAYAAALLLGRGRSGKPTRPSEEARDALLRCLLLVDPDAKLKPRDALASAVRAALRACEGGLIGGEEALAMAALLDFAAKNNKDQNLRR